MKIIVPAIGSRGDVQPYIALCQGLQRAGHQVILATNPTLSKLVESYGVTCAPVGPPVDMGVEGAKIWEKSGNRFWLSLMRTMQLAQSLVEKSFPDILAQVQGADLVLCTDIMAGAVEADKLGVPWFSITLQPGRIPDPAQKIPFLLKVFLPFFNRFVDAPSNRFRKKVGAPLISGGLGAMMSKRLVLIPVSCHVSPPNPNWPAHVQTTGYWFAENPSTWTPSADLLNFLNQGERPIAVSLGAMSLFGKATQEAAQITVEAIQQAGVRAIIQGWEEALSTIQLPDSMYHAGSMPHTWLFKQVSAVVHHGGFGTTASALRAGVPAVVVPHIIDQHFWAQRVHELGTGPKPVSRAELSVERLAAAIRQAVNDPTICQTAQSMGRNINAEPDGIQTAIHLIEDKLRALSN